jgi:hypothetical protein
MDDKDVKDLIAILANITKVMEELEKKLNRLEGELDAIKKGKQ